MHKRSSFVNQILEKIENHEDSRDFWLCSTRSSSMYIEFGVVLDINDTSNIV